MPDAPDLTFVLRSLERLQGDVADVRDEQRVQGAMFRRFDATLSIFMEEIRAMRDQVTRMNDRIRRIEDHQPDLH